MVVTGEFCDDGNISDADKCNSTCLGNVSGWLCTGGGPSSASNCVTDCGDGVKVGPEQCDNSATDPTGNDDGCDGTCQ
jgi:cysteine-rich repeat protein